MPHNTFNLCTWVPFSLVETPSCSCSAQWANVSIYIGWALFYLPASNRDLEIFFHPSYNQSRKQICWICHFRSFSGCSAHLQHVSRNATWTSPESRWWEIQNSAEISRDTYSSGQYYRLTDPNPRIAIWWQEDLKRWGEPTTIHLPQVP